MLTTSCLGEKLPLICFTLLEKFTFYILTNVHTFFSRKKCACKLYNVYISAKINEQQPFSPEAPGGYHKTPNIYTLQILLQLLWACCLNASVLHLIFFIWGGGWRDWEYFWLIIHTSIQTKSSSYTKCVKISRYANLTQNNKSRPLRTSSQTGSHEDVSHLAIPPRAMWLWPGMPRSAPGRSETLY